MAKILEDLMRLITQTELWWAIFYLLLFSGGIYLLGRGLGFAVRFEGLLPTIESISNAPLAPRSRVILSLLGIGLVVAGVIGLYRLTSMTTLEVLTSFSEEEYAQFRILEEKFNEDHKGEKLRIRSDNVNQPDLVRRLKQERIDVIIFDIAQRLELLREGLLKPIEDRRRLIPASVYLTLLNTVNFDKQLYFLPYRPNIRIGWWNSHHPTASGDCADKFKELETKQTWQAVKKFAECSKPKLARDIQDSEARMSQYGVVLSAKGAKKAAEDGDEIVLHSPPVDPALLLLEVLMASGRNPRQICKSWKKENAHSTEFSGGALRYSQYACHFNMFPAPCLIHTHHRQRGDETWRRPPKRHAKTVPSPSISRIHPPTSS